MGEGGAGTEAVAMDTTPRPRRGEGEDGGGPKPHQDDGDVAQPDPGDDPPLSADPHSERPGATEDEAPPAARAVAFVAPPASRRSVRADRRPALSDRASLALVTVRDGQVVFDGDFVLRLGALLAKESALKNVVGLDPPDQAQATLTDLAKAALPQGRHLLLVDVKASASSGEREGFLLETRTHTLLARWTLKPGRSGSTPASTGIDPDLCERLARAYASLPK